MRCIRLLRHLRSASVVGTVIVAALGCGDLGSARETPSVAEQRARAFADSAEGDRAALAALPPPLQRSLRLERYLTDAALAASPDDSCIVLPARTPAAALSERRQVHLRLPDSSAVVMFVRAEAAGPGLERVEVVRNPIDGEQRGWVWDARTDRTIEARWPRGPGGFIESAPQPRGGPIPRAVRALGRRVLALERCTLASPTEIDTAAALRDGGAGDDEPAADEPPTAMRIGEPVRVRLERPR